MTYSHEAISHASPPTFSQAKMIRRPRTSGALSALSTQTEIRNLRGPAATSIRTARPYPLLLYIASNLILILVLPDSSGAQVDLGNTAIDGFVLPDEPAVGDAKGNRKKRTLKKNKNIFGNSTDAQGGRKRTKKRGKKGGGDKRKTDETLTLPLTSSPTHAPTTATPTRSPTPNPTASPVTAAPVTLKPTKAPSRYTTGDMPDIEISFQLFNKRGITKEDLLNGAGNGPDGGGSFSFLNVFEGALQIAWLEEKEFREIEKQGMNFKSNIIQEVADLECPQGRPSIPSDANCFDITSNLTITVIEKLHDEVQETVSAVYMAMFDTGKLNYYLLKVDSIAPFRFLDNTTLDDLEITTSNRTSDTSGNGLITDAQDSSGNLGVIIGASVGGIVGLCCIFACIAGGGYWYYNKRYRIEDDDNRSSYSKGHMDEDEFGYEGHTEAPSSNWESRKGKDDEDGSDDESINDSH